ncbi:unnamed protein product, partial [Menidia menidia]
MTVITYSNVAGRLQNKIQVPEHPSACGNVPLHLCEILEPGTMQDPSEIQDRCGVKRLRQTKEREGKKQRNVQRTWLTLGRGVNRNREEPREDEKECQENRIKLKMTETHVTGTLTVIKTEGEIIQRENRMKEKKVWLGFPWLLPWKNMNKQGTKKQVNVIGLRWQDVFFWLPLLFLTLCPKPTSSQGHFPQMENIAAFKRVSTHPPRSTCGVPERSSYCQSPSSQAELLTCFQAFCDQECPYRSSTPPYAPLLLAAHRGTCVTEDIHETRPWTRTDTGTSTGSDGISAGSGSVLFQPGQDGCLVSPPSQALGALGSLTLALWIKPSSTGEMMLLEKSAGKQLVFSLTVSEQAVTMRYGQSNSDTALTVNFKTEGRLQLETWTHLTLQ